MGECVCVWVCVYGCVRARAYVYTCACAYTMWYYIVRFCMDNCPNLRN